MVLEAREVKRKDLEYIYNHYLAAIARMAQNCVGRKCGKCPFSEKEGHYCAWEYNWEKNIKVIKAFLDKTKKPEKAGK
jgi:MoaA/NifB/PqqE/SkfB family radical SAM enzyme